MPKMKQSEVSIPVGGATCRATLTVPGQARGVVLFAHGSGSGRHSPRNRKVAAALQRGGFATLLADLLTIDEEHIDADSGHLRFDISFLAARLEAMMDWLTRMSVAGLPLGIFGASTGAAAALVAAADRPHLVRAVVSRGGRPDLAGDALPRVHAPTCLIVGGFDHEVLALNEEALAQLQTTRELVVVPEASHLFPEPGALDQVTRIAQAWFERFLPEHELRPPSH